MNKNVILLVSAAAVVGLALVLNPLWAQPAATTAPARPAGAHVGVCDVVVVFNEYQRAKDLTVRLNERRDALKAENDKRGKAIDVLRTELEGLKKGSKDYETRLNEVQRLTIERSAWLQFQETLIMRDHQRLTQEMYEQILKMIQDVARREGFSLVLQRDKESMESQNTQELIQKIAARKVLYNDDSVDLTDTVLGALNDQYRLTGGATTKPDVRP